MAAVQTQPIFDQFDDDLIGDQVAALQDFVKANIAPYKYPRQIEFVAELPKTATGKIQRFRLRELEKGRG